MVTAKQLAPIVLVATLLGACLVAVLVPPTDDLSPHNSGWNGLSKAANALNARLASLKDLEAYRPDKLVILIVGVEKPVTPRQCEILKKLTMHGATIVIMDETNNANPLLDCLGLGARIGGGVLVDHLHYMLDPRLPIARLELRGNRTAKLSLDIASPIEVVGGKGSCIGYTYETAFADLNGNERLDPGEPSGRLCICYRENLGNGTVYLFSDSSILINAMIDKTDNLDVFERLVGENKTVVLVTDFWNFSPHARLVMALESLGQLIAGTSLRYTTAILLAAIVYVAVARLQKTSKVEGVEASRSTEHI